jgi:hypothetical protein
MKLHCRLPVVDCRLEKISSTLRGEDKGEGEITTLPNAGCRLRIGKTKNKQQTAISK